MKKSILLFTTIAGLLYVSLSSYQGGASIAGHAKAKDGCSGAGCHGAASTAVTSSIVVKEKSSGTVVTEYEAGVDYEVTVTGMHATATKYGYMARILDASSMQAGSFANASAGSKVQLVSGGVSVVEHSSPINASSGMFTATFDWTAPSAGTGAVTIELAVNATNGNGTADAGDVFSTSSAVVTEKNTSVGTIANGVDIKTYPNPAQNVLNIDLKNAVNGNYHLSAYNIAGQVVANEEVAVNGSSSIQLNTSAWKAGIYIIRLSKDGAQQSVKVLKQ